MLLPRSETIEAEEDDPRAELIRRLQEYERFKAAAEVQGYTLHAQKCQNRLQNGDMILPRAGLNGTLWPEGLARLV